VPAEERRGSVDERVEGGHEGAWEDQEVSIEPEEQARTEEEDEEVKVNTRVLWWGHVDEKNQR